MNSTLPRRWISPRECAERLGLHPMTIYEKFYRSELPGGRLGRTVRIDWQAVEQQLERQETRKK